jgi:hypothetical protein
VCILHVYTGTLVIHTSAVCIFHVYTGTLVIHISAVCILHVYTGTLGTELISLLFYMFTFYRDLTRSESISNQITIYIH